MECSYIGLYAEDGIFPRLRFEVDCMNINPSMYFSIVGGYVNLKVKGNQYMLCRLSPHSENIYTIRPGEKRRLIFYCDLTLYHVELIERVRGGEDLWISLTLNSKMWGRAEDFLVGASNWIVIRSAYGDIKVPKSEWVGEILPKLGYKRVRLIEVPLLPERIPEEFKDIPSYLEEAWKHYLGGDYDDAIDNCRRAMMAIATAVRKLGYEKEEIDEKTKEKRTVPDWKKFFSGHEILAESFEKMFRGLYGFLQPGSHIGRAISRPEAECAIMSTYSLANYVIKSALKSENA